ncbi:hypothetical protein [Halpernia sp.]|uniref:hypothetical protein n=1 Tax=Halpernia sp. TaxID=2782209 RepID=UPI003A92F4D8
MKIYFREFFILIISFFTFQLFSANAAQPGVWNAGGTVFTMLYPEDSATFKKVQMQEEKIYIQLYKGYTIVKGWYKMKNITSEYLNFKMGYPVNGIYYGGDSFLNEVKLDSLNRFQIKTDGQFLPVLKQKISDNTTEVMRGLGGNWLSWNIDFKPHQTRLVEVYFIVKTNDAKLTKGYNKNNYNAFIYLLESGNVWKNPINNGLFYIELKDDLTENDIKGLSKGFNFKWNSTKNILYGFKNNFIPTPKDNLVITYFKNQENFNYPEILKKENLLFQNIEQFSKVVEYQKFNEKAKEKNPYEISESILSSIISIIFVGILLSPYFIIGIIFIVTIIWLFKYLKKKKSRNNN